MPSITRSLAVEGFFIDASNRQSRAAQEDSQRDAMEVKFREQPELPQGLGSVMLAGSQVELQ